MARIALLWLCLALQSVVTTGESRYFQHSSDPPDGVMDSFDQADHAHDRSISSCGSNCNACSDPSICDTCLDATMIKTGADCRCPNDYTLVGSTCTICADSEYSIDGIECQPCYDSYCKRCTGPETDKCTQCYFNNHYIKDGVCKNQCDLGYGPDLNGKTCSLCKDTNCLWCVATTAVGQCSKCALDFEPVSAKCVACQTGYNSNGVKACWPCTQYGCQRCFSDYQCDICKTDFNKWGYDCVKCPAGTY